MTNSRYNDPPLQTDKIVHTNVPKSIVLEDKELITKIQSLSGRISDFLMVKARHEGKRQDYNNQTSLGGVMFYFNILDDGSYFLSFNKHPNTWDLMKINLEMMQLEKIMYINQGLVQDISPW